MDIGVGPGQHGPGTGVRGHDSRGCSHLTVTQMSELRDLSRVALEPGMAVGLALGVVHNTCNISHVIYYMSLQYVCMYV